MPIKSWLPSISNCHKIEEIQESAWRLCPYWNFPKSNPLIEIDQNDFSRAWQRFNGKSHHSNTYTHRPYENMIHIEWALLKKNILNGCVRCNVMWHVWIELIGLLYCACFVNFHTHFFPFYFYRCGMHIYYSRGWSFSIHSNWFLFGIVLLVDLLCVFSFVYQ